MLNFRGVFQRQSVSVAFRGATVGHKRLTVLELLWHVELSPTSLYYWIYMYENCCIYIPIFLFIYLQIAYDTHYTPWCIGIYIIYWSIIYYYHHILGRFRAEQDDVKVVRIKIFLSEDALVETKLDWISFELAWISVWFKKISYEILRSFYLKILVRMACHILFISFASCSVFPVKNLTDAC